MANVDPTQRLGAQHVTNPRYFLRERKRPVSTLPKPIGIVAKQHVERLDPKRVSKGRVLSKTEQKKPLSRKREYSPDIQGSPEFEREPVVRAIDSSPIPQDAQQIDGITHQTADVLPAKLEPTALAVLKTPIEMILIPFPFAHEEVQKKVREDYRRLKELFINSPDVSARFEDITKRITFYHHELEIKAILLVENFELNQSLTLTRSPCSLTIRGTPSFTLASESRDKFLQREADLYRLADDFFKASHPANIELSAPLPVDRIIPGLLESYQGICIGELHSHLSPKKFLIDHMPTLKEAGVKTLFLEHLFYDSMQKWLDDYFQTASDAPMPKYLQAYLNNLSSGQSIFRTTESNYNYLEIVRAAKELGIRIVGLDTTISYLCGASDKLGVKNSHNRYVAMNYTSVQIIRLESKGEKFVAFMGSGHVGTTLGVPGVASLLRCPSVIIEDKPQGKTTPQLYFNVKNYQGAVEHVSVLVYS